MGTRWIEAELHRLHGMSGSPIVNGKGAAIGVICTDHGVPNPRLVHHLPAGILEAITKPKKAQARRQQAVLAARARIRQQWPTKPSLG